MLRHLDLPVPVDLPEYISARVLVPCQARGEKGHIPQVSQLLSGWWTQGPDHPGKWGVTHFFLVGWGLSRVTRRSPLVGPPDPHSFHLPIPHYHSEFQTYVLHKAFSAHL